MPTIFYDIFHTILDWIFPASPEIQEIELMSPVEFSQIVRRVLDALPPGISSMFKYKDPFVRKALWALKYDGNKHIAKLFAGLLHESMIEPLTEAELYDNFIDPIIMPIPLSRERYKERGWNQAELVAKELLKRNPQFELHTTILRKIKHTTPQTKLSREQRLHNLKNCFEVDPNLVHCIKSRNIILIDDVTTTGSTIIEARRTLLSSGARQVLAFTIAH